MTELGETVPGFTGEQLVQPEFDHDRPTRVGIVNLGSQLVKPIDRRLREIGADTIIFEHDVSADELTASCDAVVFSGGGDSVNDPEAVWADSRVYEPDFPLPAMYICLGFQQLNHARGGTVEQGVKGRYGQSEVTITDQSHPLLADRGEHARVLLNAGDSVTPDNLAPGLRPIAFSRIDSHEIVAAFVDEEAPADAPKVAVQFHPEVDLTENGNDIFRRFVRDVAGMPLNYTAEEKRATVSRHVRVKVGSFPVVTAASGGVDSSVLAAAVDEEIGDHQHVIHIDTGLMRKGESDLVLEAFRERGVRNVHFIDATNRFRRARTFHNGRLTATLEYETDPEAKRHIIGDTFARVLDDAFKDLGLTPATALLAQGTLRPDLIESAGVGKSSKKIKTHHNDTSLIRAWRESGMVLEPLSDLHKDEVRELGLELGLSEEVVWRQPFPGPGLAVRTICAKRPADFEGRRQVEDRLRYEFGDQDTSVHLLPIRTVGVQGDARTYRHVAAISTDDEPDWERFMEYAQAIPQEVRHIGRVVFMFGGQVERQRSLFDTVLPTTLRPRIVSTLQEADDAVNEAMRQHDLVRKLSQEPVILTPLQIDQARWSRLLRSRQNRMLVLRPFVTNDFMVGSAAVPGSEKLPLAALHDQVEAALSVPGIGRVAIDLTGKPPGTTEWE